MPMSGRVDMLKLRYFWKLEHTTEKNVTYQVYRALRKNFLIGNQGYIHESLTYAASMKKWTYGMGNVQTK